MIQMTRFCWPWLWREADYLITGDRRAGLLQLGHIERTRIVTPGVFCTEVL